MAGKKRRIRKKAWVKPVVDALRVNKDTFSGSGLGFEVAGKAGLPQKT